MGLDHKSLQSQRKKKCHYIWAYSIKWAPKTEEIRPLKLLGSGAVGVGAESVTSELVGVTETDGSTDVAETGGSTEPDGVVETDGSTDVAETGGFVVDGSAIFGGASVAAPATGLTASMDSAVVKATQL